MKTIRFLIIGGLLAILLTQFLQVTLGDEEPARSYPRAQIDQNRAPIESDASSLNSAAGGAAMADFGTLMNLIESTVDPDSWLSGGGTSVMLPFPAGVWVDPRGKLARNSVSLVDDHRLTKLLNSRGVPQQSSSLAWHSESSLRMISLRQLDQLLWNASRSMDSRSMATVSPEVIRLAGLGRVQYVLVDLEHEDLILAGPADGNQNGFFLEDLAVVIGLIHRKTESFGCSIEPVHENLVRTQEYISSARAQKLLAQSPEKFAKQLEQLIGLQEAMVFGMPARTGTAVALLAADVMMKELGFGKSDLPVNLPTYFDFLEAQSVIPKQSMVRWWFDYSNQSVASNQDHTLFRLPNDCVTLFSEQQFVSRAGRQATGLSDPAADAFAAEFNRHLGELREVDPSFSRMCCVFETALALQLSLESIGMADYRAWFPTLCGLGRMEQEIVNQPQWVGCLVASRPMKTTRTNIAVVSGGVRIQPELKASRVHWQVTSHLSGSQVPQKRETTQSSHWWWD